MPSVEEDTCHDSPESDECGIGVAMIVAESSPEEPGRSK